jgi:thiamine kinase-like enzyme
VGESFLNVELVTPEWLTHRLSDRVIQQVEVVGTKTSNVAGVYFLRAVDSTKTVVPLFLKIAKTDKVWGKKEIQFYTEIAPIVLQRFPDFPIIPYYAVEHDTDYYLLLMDDLSATHVSGHEVGIQHSPHYKQIIDGFAMFHACWWEHPNLGGGLRAEQIDEMIENVRKKREDFLSYTGDTLSIEQKAILQRVGWAAKRRERVLGGKGITYVHRDTHPGNFLYPLTNGTPKIIDWQSWRVDTGTDDLAYMIACHWDPEMRQSLELPLLQRYHAKLQAFGVPDYSWDDCLYDYRASILRCLFFLLAAWRPDQSPAWHDRLERGMLAYQGFECEKLDLY